MKITCRLGLWFGLGVRLGDKLPGYFSLGQRNFFEAFFLFFFFEPVVFFNSGIFPRENIFL